MLTFGSECDKVNELLISNESQKSLKSFEKNLKKFLTNRNDCDKLNELSQDGEQRTLITKQ